MTAAPISINSPVAARPEPPTPSSSASTPTAPPSSDPRERSASSLYSLGIQAQDIEGEIAMAAELLESDDPEQEAAAIALIEQYLEASSHTKALLVDKADKICLYIDHLEAVAKFRSEQAARLKALAAADEKRIESLKRYMLNVLTALYPSERKFSLPTHELTSRRSEKAIVDDPDLIPAEFNRIKAEPDKTAIKTALKAGKDVPGAHLETNLSWSIK
ncbi:MAG: siphovirus Gp157 family protein [Steroidobacteraceae bacterium]